MSLRGLNVIIGAQVHFPEAGSDLSPSSSYNAKVDVKPQTAATMLEKNNTRTWLIAGAIVAAITAFFMGRR